MNTNPQGTVLGKVQKNIGEDLVLQAVRFGGYDLLDLRVFTKTMEGELTLTKKGLCLRPEVWAKILPLLAKAVAEAEGPKANGGNGYNG